MKKKIETKVGKIHPGKNQRFLFKEKENIPNCGRVGNQNI